MRIAVTIPVKTFSKAKTRMGLAPAQTEDLCKFMLEKILHTISISPRIEETIMVTRDKDAIRIGEEFGATIVVDHVERGVNNAVSLADKYLLEKGFDASIVLPQDIPCIRTQDIDFMLNYIAPPNFAIIVPSRKFDGTNALVRMPIDLMGTHYDVGVDCNGNHNDNNDDGSVDGINCIDGDEHIRHHNKGISNERTRNVNDSHSSNNNNSYRMHMAAAKECTSNAAMVFVKRIMWDIDDMGDLRFLMQHGHEDPSIVERIVDIVGDIPQDVGHV